MEHTKTYLDYKKKANEKFVRYDEGAEMYHMGISKFMQIAKDAKACYKIGQMVLVKLEIICRLRSKLIDYVIQRRYNLFEVANCDLK